jgi:thiol-disulfide isomerase/thioredoxin
MASFYEVVSNYLGPYAWYIFIVVLLVIFSLLAKYGYETYYAAHYESGEKKFNDIANAEMRDNEVFVYFFYVDWCPHCKTALPDWIKFKNQYDETDMNGYTLRCVDMNCTDETPEIESAINTYGIKGYPTIKMKKDGKVIEFDSKITYSALEKFVQMMTQQ